MKIAVDARTIYDEEVRGIGKYATELYRHLALARPTWEFLLFHAEPATRREPHTGEPLFAGLANICPQQITLRGDRFSAWERVRFPFAVWQSRADFVHAPAGVSSPWLPTPLVATVHDLIPWETKRTDAAAQRWLANIRRSLQRSRAIVTDSAYTRGKILEFGGEYLASKIHVVPLAATSQPTAPPAEQRRRELAQRLGIAVDQGFVLHFGMRDPRKGTAELLRAWSLISTELRRLFPLVIVGLSDAARADFEVLADKIHKSENIGVGSVRLFGYVEEETAQDLLAMASVLAYPTQLEGFGLPILDGFAAGVPVLTGTSSSLPEVAGDAALSVNVMDVQALARGLTELLSSESLRSDLIQRGRIRLRDYSWERTSELTAQVMESIH